LIDLVLARLDSVPLANESSSLLLAACESEIAYLSSSAESSRVDQRHHECVPTNPAGAYLRAISVSGFRGVGRSSTLQLEPGRA
jgi:hypothetical protein